MLQPVLVRPLDDGSYQLVAGERRWRAARRAGLPLIPAIVRAADDLATVERALVENLHRQDLTPLEEAAAFQQLTEDFGLTHEQIASRVGKSRSAITNTLRLMSLPAAVQHLLADGRLSAGHAKALLGCPDRSLQEQLAKACAAENWSVRMMEEAVRRGALPQDLAGRTAGAGQCRAARSVRSGRRLDSVRPASSSWSGCWSPTCPPGWPSPVANVGARWSSSSPTSRISSGSTT